MAIEIRELLIKVKVEEERTSTTGELEIQRLRQSILKECKKEIRKQLNRTKER